MRENESDMGSDKGKVARIEQNQLQWFRSTELGRQANTFSITKAQGSRRVRRARKCTHRVHTSLYYRKGKEQGDTPSNRSLVSN